MLGVRIDSYCKCDANLLCVSPETLRIRLLTQASIFNVPLKPFHLVCLKSRTLNFPLHPSRVNVRSRISAGSLTSLLVPDIPQLIQIHLAIAIG